MQVLARAVLLLSVVVSLAVAEDLAQEQEKSEDRAERRHKAHDTDEDGGVTLEEALNRWVRRRDEEKNPASKKQQYYEAKVTELFQKNDHDGDGKLDVKEFEVLEKDVLDFSLSHHHGKASEL